MANAGFIKRAAQALSRTSRSFGSDKSGNVAIMVGLLAFPMLAAVGVAVDMGETHRAKVNFQAALDAGALAAAKAYARGKTPNDAADAANRVFKGNIQKTLPGSIGTITMTSKATDCTSTGIVATGTLKHPIFFGKVHKVFQDAHPGYAFMQGSTTVKCGAQTVEIAMVLDNSGSMGENSKLDTLKTASKDLVDTVFDSLSESPFPEPVKFSLVPFSAMVNVGKANKNAVWMDTQGKSTHHHENLKWDDDPLALKDGKGYKNRDNGKWLTRFTLFDEMRVDWKGCVEARPDPYFVTDEPADAAKPDTLLVPAFAPDEPDKWSDGSTKDRIQSGPTRNIYCVSWYNHPQYGKDCNRWSDGGTQWYHPKTGRQPDYYSADYGGNGVWQRGDFEDGVWVNGDVLVEEQYFNNYLSDSHNFAASGLPEVLARDHTGTAPAAGERQHKRHSWTWKYFNRPTITSSTRGPNYLCDSQPMTPLSTSRSLVKGKIEQMVAEGWTNVQQGAMWGWRALSPQEPLTDGRPYGRNDNRKVMILLTDGQNTYLPATRYTWASQIDKSAYAAWGQQRNGRLFESYKSPQNPDGPANPGQDGPTYTKAMDYHLSRTCVNAKAEGIQIYSIAFDVANGSSVKKVLEDCASDDAGGKLYYDADNNASLVKAFQSIAEKLAELSITK